MKPEQSLTTEDEVKEELEMRLGRVVRRSVWRVVKNNGYAEKVIEAEGDKDIEASLRFILEAIPEIEQDFEEHRTRGRSVDDIISDTYKVTPLDKLFQEAIYQFIETQVSLRRDVRIFRAQLNKCLPDDYTVSREDTLHVLNLPVPTFLTFRRVKQLGITLLTDLSVEVDPCPTVFQYKVHPHLSTITENQETGEGFFHYRRLAPSTTVAFEPWECIGIDWRNSAGFTGVVRHPFMARFVPSGRLYNFNDAVVFKSQAAANSQVLTFTRTIAGRAIRIAERIARDYTIDVVDALELLVSGHLARRAIVASQYSSRKVFKDGTCEVEYLAHGPIMLKVEPWVPVKEVARMYRAMQHEVLSDKDNRPLKADNVRLFSFLAGRLNALRGAVDWPALRKAWITDGGKAVRSGDLPLFYRRVRDKLLPIHYWATSSGHWMTKRCQEEEARREESKRRKESKKSKETAPTD